jgi:hypothetical protein
MRAPILLCLAATLALGGCALFKDKPIIEKRYRTASWDAPATAAPDPAAASTAAMTLSVSTAPVSEKSASVAITALSDRGQAALIAALNGKPPIALKESGDEAGKPRVVVRGTVQRKVVVALRPTDFLNPGDRVEAVRLTLAVDPSQAGAWKITGWTQATNGVEAIELGKVKQESSQTFSGETGLDLGSSLTGAKISAESTRSNTQEATLKDDGAINAAVENNGEAWLDSNAGWRTNLARNLSMDVVVTAVAGRMEGSPVMSYSALSKTVAGAAPARTPPAEVYIYETDEYVSRDSEAPVCGTARITYRMRRITGGAETFTESDDDVSFQVRQTSARFMLAPPPYRPLYGIFVGEDALSYERRGKPVGLSFSSLKEAIAFADWLAEAQPAGGGLASGTAVGIAIAHGIQPLTAAQYRTLTAGVLDPDAVARAETALLHGCP